MTEGCIINVNCSSENVEKSCTATSSIPATDNIDTSTLPSSATKYTGTARTSLPTASSIDTSSLSPHSTKNTGSARTSILTAASTETSTLPPHTGNTASNSATLAGGVVGGVLGGVVITVVVVVVWWICRRKRLEAAADDETKRDSHIRTGPTSIGDSAAGTSVVPDLIKESVTTATEESANEYQVIPDIPNYQLAEGESKVHIGKSKPGSKQNTPVQEMDELQDNYTEIRVEKMDGTRNYSLGKASPKSVTKEPGSEINGRIQDTYNRIGATSSELSQNTDAYNRIGINGSNFDVSVPNTNLGNNFSSKYFMVESETENQDTYDKLRSKDKQPGHKHDAYERIGNQETKHSANPHPGSSSTVGADNPESEDTYNRLGNNHASSEHSFKDIYNRLGDTNSQTENNDSTEAEYFVLENTEADDHDTYNTLGADNDNGKSKDTYNRLGDVITK